MDENNFSHFKLQKSNYIFEQAKHTRMWKHSQNAIDKRMESHLKNAYF